MRLAAAGGDGAPDRPAPGFPIMRLTRLAAMLPALLTVEGLTWVKADISNPHARAFPLGPGEHDYSGYSTLTRPRSRRSRLEAPTFSTTVRSHEAPRSAWVETHATSFYVVDASLR